MGGGGGGGGGGQTPTGAAAAEATGPWGDSFNWRLDREKQLRLVTARTHALVPAQPGGVVLFDVALQIAPDGQVRLHPINMSLVPVRRGNKVIR